MLDSSHQANCDAKIEPSALAVLRLLDSFFGARDEMLRHLVGRTYRPDPIRDELMRRVCLDAGSGRARRLADYQRDLSAYWSKTSIRRGMEKLEAIGLIVMEALPSEPRNRLVRPTQKLADFYNKQMPDLVAAAVARGVKVNAL